MFYELYELSLLFTENVYCAVEQKTVYSDRVCLSVGCHIRLAKVTESSTSSEDGVDYTKAEDEDADERMVGRGPW